MVLRLAEAKVPNQVVYRVVETVLALAYLSHPEKNGFLSGTKKNLMLTTWHSRVSVRSIGLGSRSARKDCRLLGGRTTIECCTLADAFNGSADGAESTRHIRDVCLAIGVDRLDFVIIGDNVEEIIGFKAISARS